MQKINMVAEAARDVLGPAGFGRNAAAGRQADANCGNFGEFAPLHHGVGELGRAEHYRVDAAFDAGLVAENLLQSIENPGADVPARQGFGRGKHRVAFEQHRVGMRPTDIDSDAAHQ